MKLDEQNCSAKDMEPSWLDVAALPTFRDLTVGLAVDSPTVFLIAANLLVCSTPRIETHLSVAAAEALTRSDYLILEANN